MFQRTIVGNNTSISITNCSYLNGETTGEDPCLSDEAKLKEISDTLAEIEQVIDNNPEEIEWRVYGRRQVW